MNQQKIKLILVLLIIVLSVCLIMTTLQTDRHRLAGGIIMMQQVDIVTDTGGTIKNVYHQQGDAVQPGDILYEIDGQELADNIAKAEEAIRKIEEDLRALTDPSAARAGGSSIEETVYQQAANKAQQYQSLYDQGAISRNMLIQAQAERDLAYQALQTARARSAVYDAGNPTVIAMKQEELVYAKQNLQTLQEQSKSLTIVSPAGGIVASQIYQVGQRVEKGYRLAEIAIKENCMLNAYLSDEQKTKLTEGQEVEIKIGAYPDRTFSGIVESIEKPSTEAAESKQEVLAKIKMNNTDNLLRAGMQADIYID